MTERTSRAAPGGTGRPQDERQQPHHPIRRAAPQAGDILDQGPPVAHESEAAVVASVMLDWRVLDGVAGLLRPEDMADPRAAAVYSAMLRLREQGDALASDATLIVRELRLAGDLDRCGAVVSVGYLLRLLDMLPTAARWPMYAADVSAVAQQRRKWYRQVDELAATAREIDDWHRRRHGRGGAA